MDVYLDLKEIKDINPKNIILYKTNKYEKIHLIKGFEFSTLCLKLC